MYNVAFQVTREANNDKIHKLGNFEWGVAFRFLSHTST